MVGNVTAFLPKYVYFPALAIIRLVGHPFPKIIPFFPFVPCVLACVCSNAHVYTVFLVIFPFA